MGKRERKGRGEKEGEIASWLFGGNAPGGREGGMRENLAPTAIKRKQTDNRIFISAARTGNSVSLYLPTTVPLSTDRLV